MAATIESWRCSKCSKICATRIGLQLHTQLKHAALSCPHCDEKFCSVQELNGHCFTVLEHMFSNVPDTKETMDCATTTTITTTTHACMKQHALVPQDWDNRHHIGYAMAGVRGQPSAERSETLNSFLKSGCNVCSVYMSAGFFKQSSNFWTSTMRIWST